MNKHRGILLALSAVLLIAPVAAHGQTKARPAATAQKPSPRFTAQEVALLYEVCERAGGTTSLEGNRHVCVKGRALNAANLADTPTTRGGSQAAQPPSRVDSGQLKSMSAWDLCTNFASARAARRSTVALEAEIHTRGLGCAGRATAAAGADRPAAQTYSATRTPAAPAASMHGAAPAVGLCAGLSVTDISQVQRGMIFTVTNLNAQPRSFRIHYRGIQSSQLRIPGRTTKPFGVQVSASIGGLGALGAQSRGETDELINDCSYF